MNNTYPVQPPFIIGLTGGIGSGKTTVANLFIGLGIFAVDADIVAREVVQPGTPALAAIKAHFGGDIIDANGELARSTLREIIFTKPEEKQWLNALLHPLIRQEIFAQLASATSPYCLLIAPLLFETQLHLHVDRTLTIDVDQQSQIKRTAKRDNCPQSVVKSIIASQISRDDRLALSDDIINNQDQTMAQLMKAVANFDKKYQKLALEKKNS